MVRKSLTSNWYRCISDSHICCKCGKSSNIRCLCCPTSVCWHCIVDSDVVQTEGEKGFCSKCLNLALMIEEDKSEDSDGVCCSDSYNNNKLVTFLNAL